MNSLIPDIINKVYVLVSPDGVIMNIIPHINFDILFILLLFIVLFDFICDVTIVFISNWKENKKHAIK